MQGLRSKVLTFSKELQEFSQQVSNGIEDIKLSTRSKPSVGATAFRENLEELKQQVKGVEQEIFLLGNPGTASVPLEELLVRCLGQLEDNSKRIGVLEGQLRGYGYGAQFQAPRKPPPAQIAAESLAHSNEPSPSPQATLLWDDPVRKRSYSSPGNLTDDVLGPARREQGLQLHFPTVTPSPIPSTVPSMSSVSPSLRELQLKYGQLGLSDSSPESQQTHSIGDASQSTRGGVCNRAASDEATVSSKSKRGEGVTSVNPESTLMMPNAHQDSESHLSTSKPLTIQTGRRHGSGGGTSSPNAVNNNNSPMGRGEILASRLAAGEAPWDMLSLKAAINNAPPGTGQVGEAIGRATFHPQAAAFTSLLHMCAKNKLWEKALEVFEGMKKYHPGVIPNTVHFSSLISACGTAGRWKEAMQVFEEMKAQSAKDAQCKPNVISYSALMTACCAGGRPDKAHEAFLDMKAQGIKPDHISYSTLIAGFERWGDLEKATLLFEEMKDAGLLHKAQGSAAKIPSYLEQFNRKLQRSSSRADLEGQEAGQGSDAGHRAWGSFGSNGTSVDSPFIGAHYGSPGLSRGGSIDLATAAADEDSCFPPLRNELLHLRSPSHASFTDGMVSTPLGPHAVFSMAKQTPHQAQRQPATPVTAHLYSAARGRHRPHLRSSAPSPLAQSYDSNHMPGHSHLGAVIQPPSFRPPLDALPIPALDPPAASLAPNLEQQLGTGDRKDQAFGADALQQLVNAAGLDMDLASQLLGALVQQQTGIQPAMQQGLSPLPTAPRESFLPQALPSVKAANGAPQIAQITVEEYNNIPLRFSRQLSLDQMNEAVDYINAVVEGKHNNHPGSQGHGVNPQELVPLELGNQRTTALLNCLLQLRRVRLTVRDGQQDYLLLSTE